MIDFTEFSKSFDVTKVTANIEFAQKQFIKNLETIAETQAAIATKSVEITKNMFDLFNVSKSVKK